MSGLEELYGDASEATPTPEAQPAPAPEAVTQAEPAVTTGAPVEATPVVETPLAAAPTQPQEREKDWVPVALLDEREKRRAAEAKAAQLEAWRAEQERKAREATEQMPHPLDDPERFAQWLLHQQRTAVQREVGSLSTRHQQQVEVISRNMMQRYLGPEKFAELDQFIQAAPDQAHAIAMKQADPYGWFHEKFEQAQKARKAEAAAKQLEQFGGKSVEEIIAERIAAERARWEAERGGGQPQPAQVQPAADTRPRNPDGTFAPSQPEQRHRPESLAKMNGAAIIAATAPGSALDELYG